MSYEGVSRKQTPRYQKTPKIIKKGNKMATNLNKAKKAKNDEFYTLYSDVEKELAHYQQHFKGKIVYCNCDNPEWSAFWRYFHINFSTMGLKKLIATYKGTPTYKMEYTGGNDIDVTVGLRTPLKGDGDFRSQECLDVLKVADIVVTNPPFSLFREYVAQLMEYGKKFIIIGSKNAITYKDFFPLLKDNKVWIGYNNVNDFQQPDGSFKKFGNIGWFTNLCIKKRHEKIVLRKIYTPEEYPTYDNYEAINVNKTAEIPSDYDGVMGVPISFLDKYNPNQFEIVGWSRHNDLNMDGGYWKKGTCNDALIGGKSVYTRILIRKK